MELRWNSLRQQWELTHGSKIVLLWDELSGSELDFWRSFAARRRMAY